MDQYKMKQLQEKLWKIFVVVFAIAFAAVVIYYRLDSIVSRFRFYKDGQTLIFVDKYVNKNEDRRFRAEWKPVAEKFLSQSGLDKALAGKNINYKPEVIFLVQDYYSIIDLQDPYIEKKLKAMPSTDIQLLQRARSSSFFDSFVSHTFTSQDGRYIFISNLSNAEENLAYALMHGLVGKNMPESAKEELRGSNNWNFSSYISWMLIEEMAAITAQELQKRFMEGKNLNQALDALYALPEDYYTNPEANPVKKFMEYYYLNFQISDKLPELYQKSLDMAKHLISTLGHEGFMAYITKVATGSFNTIGELVSSDMNAYIEPILSYYEEISRIAKTAVPRSSMRSAPPGQ